MHRTFPDNVLFRSSSESCLQTALYNVLLAYGHHNNDVGYCQVPVPPYLLITFLEPVVCTLYCPASGQGNVCSMSPEAMHSCTLPLFSNRLIKWAAEAFQKTGHFLWMSAQFQIFVIIVFLSRFLCMCVCVNVHQYSYICSEIMYYFVFLSKNDWEHVFIFLNIKCNRSYFTCLFAVVNVWMFCRVFQTCMLKCL